MEHYKLCRLTGKSNIFSCFQEGNTFHCGVLKPRKPSGGISLSLRGKKTNKWERRGADAACQNEISRSEKSETSSHSPERKVIPPQTRATASKPLLIKYTNTVMPRAAVVKGVQPQTWISSVGGLKPKSVKQTVFRIPGSLKQMSDCYSSTWSTGSTQMFPTRTEFGSAALISKRSWNFNDGALHQGPIWSERAATLKLLRWCWLSRRLLIIFCCFYVSLSSTVLFFLFFEVMMRLVLMKVNRAETLK